MVSYCGEERWYALRIRTKWSQRIVQSLKNKQFITFNPTYSELSKRKDRKKLLNKPIFGGYLFVQAKLTTSLHLEILKTHGVTDFIKNDHNPIPIPDDQIEKIRSLEEHLEQCTTLSSEFIPGDPVRIIEGPLAGLIGLVDQIDRNRLRIYFNSIPSSINIEINPDHVESLKGDPLYLSVTGQSVIDPSII